jgi:hypothetical protein
LSPAEYDLDPEFVEPDPPGHPPLKLPDAAGRFWLDGEPMFDPKPSDRCCRDPSVASVAWSVEKPPA